MRARTITDRQPYLKAHKNYDELHDLLGNLQGKLSEVSKDVDKEFLASYRVHMLSIQTEIKNLREDVDKGVQALKSDGNVHKLELEVNWFVEECTRLRLHYTTMENDCFQMQSRYKAMMDQKVYMNEQLKAILKRNRVLEAEIEHALKYNQKVKLADDQNDLHLWDEHKEEPLGFEDDLQNSEEMNNDDLPPDNYYHEQLRRLSEKSPLSTSVFVPPVGGRRGRSSKGSSRQGSRPTSRGSSRGSSQSPSRTGTPGSPSRPMQGPGGAALNKTMVSIRSHHSAEHDDDEDIGFEDAAQRQFVQDFQQGASLQHSQSLNSLPPGSKQAMFAHPSQQGPNNNDTTTPHTSHGAGNQGTESRRGPVPKQQPLPAGVWRARQKMQAQKHRHNREQLVDFLKHKSPAEANLEKAIADIFSEVRARKVVAAKRGAIKRYPVSFMGNEDNVSAAEEALQQQNNNNNIDNNNMLRKRSGASSTSLQNQNTTSLQGGVGAGGAGGAGSPMAGIALGRRLSASAHTASNTANNTGSNTADSDRAPDGDLGNEEQDLLRQPLIQATGGISGLGAKQLSDNDKFSVVVKYLLDYDRFRELVDKLQQR